VGSWIRGSVYQASKTHRRMRAGYGGELGGAAPLQSETGLWAVRREVFSLRCVALAYHIVHEYPCRSH
jgi:hypothetical protein